MKQLTNNLITGDTVDNKIYGKENCQHWCYYVISEKAYQTDAGEYLTHSIKVTGSNYIDVLHDISVYEDQVSQMTELFNLYQLSPVHLQDAVENMLN